MVEKWRKTVGKEQKRKSGEQPLERIFSDFYIESLVVEISKPRRSIQDPLPENPSKSYAQAIGTKGKIAIKFSKEQIEHLAAPFRYALIGKFSQGKPPLEEQARQRRRVEESQRLLALELQRKEEERQRELEMIQRQKVEAARRKRQEDEEERANQKMLNGASRSRSRSIGF